METFASPHMPFGRRYQYEVDNIQWPRDNKYFVTVVYETQSASTSRDQYLRWWFHNHPALIQVRSSSHFKEVYAGDPVYNAYLGRAIPNPPAILITAPPRPGEGYFGQTVYCAYGQYLSTNPNVIAREIQQVFNTMDQMELYGQQIIQPLPPVKPVSTPVSTDMAPLLLIAGAAILVFIFLSGRRRR